MRTRLTAFFITAVAGVVVVRAGTPNQGAVFRGRVDSVEVPVAVMSGSRTVPGLTAVDFELFDNGVRQTILDVSRETVPIDVTLVIDVSGSVHGDRLAALTRAVASLKDRLHADDRISLITFNQRVRERLRLAPASQLASVPVRGEPGLTSLYDAIVLALAAPSPTGRRQMAIICTDGLDTLSFMNEPAVLDVARRSSAAVFAVIVASGGNAVPMKFFESLTDMTGGVTQLMGNVLVSDVERREFRSGSEGKLDDSFVRAFDDFRTSYLLRYVLAGTPRTGWHVLDVRVAKPGRYQVRARRGYIGG